MDFRFLAFASASALMLATACGEPDTVETPTSEDTAVSSDNRVADETEDMSGTGTMSGSSDNGTDNMSDETTMDGQSRPANGVPPLLDRIEGDWVSGEDDGSEMSIVDGTATMMYDGEVLTTETIEVVETCPDAAGDASDDMQLITMTADDTGETLCYGIINLSEDRLELTSYPRGNTLTYTRQPMTGMLDEE